jgi:stearoyl-CoA desaturase (delta-9 desaturase)
MAVSLPTQSLDNPNRFASLAQPEPQKSFRFAWEFVLFFVVFHALALVGGIVCFSWPALGVALLLHWCFGSLGICLGYHRLLSHRSFQVPKWLEYVFATFGALAIQGGADLLGGRPSSASRFY